MLFICCIEDKNWITPTGIYNDTVFPALPSDIIEVIKLITPDPEAWFVGQFANYLLRPTDEFGKEIEEWKNFKMPYAAGTYHYH